MKKIILSIYIIIFPILVSAEGIKAEINGLHYMLYPDAKKAEVIHWYDYRGDIVIPESINYEGESYKVVTIGFEAFSECRITSVSIPNSVNNIDVGAFRECGGLTTVTIPSSVKYLSDEAFSWCGNLASVTINNGVKYIGRHCFNRCTKLTSLDIPNSVTIIDEGAFSSSGLTSVIVPNSVISIGYEAFECCYGLKYVSLGSGVAHIGERAFRECYELIVVSLIESPFSIVENPKPKDRSDVTFTRSSTLYVPSGTIEKYKNTRGWKDLKIIEGSGPSSVANIIGNYLLVQSNGSTLEISGADAGTAINVYDTAGRLVGAAKASAGTTSVGTSLSSGEIGIVKIGEKAVKVVIQ